MEAKPPPINPLTGKLMPRSTGRPKGSKNKLTLLREKTNVAILETAAAEGISPLDVLLRLMRRAWNEAQQLESLARTRPLTESEDKALQQARTQAHEVAVDAAPFLHPKLRNQDTRMVGDLTITLAKF